MAIRKTFYNEQIATITFTVPPSLTVALATLEAGEADFCFVSGLVSAAPTEQVISRMYDFFLFGSNNSQTMLQRSGIEPFVGSMGISNFMFDGTAFNLSGV